MDVPAMEWAVFTTRVCTNEEATSEIQALWKRIGPEWWSQVTEHEHANAPEFEMYYPTSIDKFLCEIWIPLIKK